MWWKISLGIEVAVLAGLALWAHRQDNDNARALAALPFWAAGFVIVAIDLIVLWYTLQSETDAIIRRMVGF